MSECEYFQKPQRGSFVPSAKVTWDIDTSRRRAGVIKIQRLTLSPIIPCIHVKTFRITKKQQEVRLQDGVTAWLLGNPRLESTGLWWCTINILCIIAAFSKISLFLHHLRRLEKLVQSSSECGKGHLGEDYTLCLWFKTIFLICFYYLQFEIHVHQVAAY